MDHSKIYESLEALCAEHNTNLTEACRNAGINRSIPERWKESNPKTLNILAALIQSIKEPDTQKKVIKFPGGKKMTRG
jgi:hypothetical protein